MLEESGKKARVVDIVEVKDNINLEKYKVEKKEVKKTTDTKTAVKPKTQKPKTTTRKTTKKKEEKIVEKYQYKGDKEELIMDKPSTPLIKKNVNPVIKSNKELYESYVKELVNFSLSVNNEVLYDSKLDKKKDFPIVFENDFFILYGKKYSYNGLKIKKIN
jgi:hypothetical protein